MQGVPDLVPLHIGPSGALRIPLQQFSSVMISGIKKLQQDKQNQHEHEFEILNLDDAAELSAQAQVRTTSSSSPVSEPCHGTGTQARSWSASFNAAQLVGSYGAEADGPGDSYELLPREHDAGVQQQPAPRQEDGQQPEHGGLDLHARVGECPDPQDAVGVRRGGQRKLLSGSLDIRETPRKSTTEPRLSPEIQCVFGSTYGSQCDNTEERRSQGGGCPWPGGDLRREPVMPLWSDGTTSPGTDGGSELRPDFLPVPRPNREPMPILHVDDTTAVPRRDQLEVPGSRPRQDTSCRSSSADGSGEVHSSQKDTSRNEWPGGTRDLQDLPQDPQAGAQARSRVQGQEQPIRDFINGISRGDARVPEVSDVAQGRREVSAEALRPLTERQSSNQVGS